MKDIAISINNLSKCYDLGAISTGTLNQDLSLFWSRLSGKGYQEKLLADRQLRRNFQKDLLKEH